MEPFNIVGIDPGKNTGITVLTIKHDELNNRYEPIYSYSILVSMDNRLDMVDRIEKIKRVLRNLILIYDPVLVTIEAAFLNIRFPKAVIILTQYIQAIKDILYSFNRSITILDIPPKKIKAMTSDTGTSDKIDMKNAIANTMIGDMLGEERILEMSEHEVDSAMIALTGLMWLNNNFKL